MKLLLASVIAVTAAVGLGGCWAHHEPAVVVTPVPEYEPVYEQIK